MSDPQGTYLIYDHGWDWAVFYWNTYGWRKDDDMFFAHSGGATILVGDGRAIWLAYEDVSPTDTGGWTIMDGD